VVVASPGHAPQPPLPPPAAGQSSLTMDLEPLGTSPVGLNDDATRRNERASIGDEPTIPAEPPRPPGVETTLPDPVTRDEPCGRVIEPKSGAMAKPVLAEAKSGAMAKPGLAEAKSGATAKPGVKAEPKSGPMPKPEPASKSNPPKGPESKPPGKPETAEKPKTKIEVHPLGSDKPESYSDGALPWIASAFAVMVIGTGVMFFLILLLYIV